jgi:hypothetical protein
MEGNRVVDPKCLGQVGPIAREQRVSEVNREVDLAEPSCPYEPIMRTKTVSEIDTEGMIVHFCSR